MSWLLLCLLACDGATGPSDSDSSGTWIDQDQDGWPAGEDCDDTDPTVNPDAEEQWWDGVDQDCKGDNDYDSDHDGHDAEPWGDDCDDDAHSVHPGATDQPYDGLDADCDGGNDYDHDRDGEEARPYEDDCNDDDETIHSRAEEVWYDGIDQDCDGNDDDQDLDGQTAEEAGGFDCDDLDPEITAVPGMDDNDGDGYGNPATQRLRCPADPDAVDEAGDCDDSDPEVHPEATEVWYDGVDSDCAGDDDYDADADGETPYELGGTDCNDQDPAITSWDKYPDVDGDGDGDATATAGISCDDSEGVNNNLDCDDSRPDIHVGATEIWYDGVDQDCDGASDYDADGDGTDAFDHGGTDCDDSDPVSVGGERYQDLDGDGYGDPLTPIDCDTPGGSSTSGDCDDSDASIYPGATDVALDGVDQDCDGDAAVTDAVAIRLDGDDQDGLAGTALIVTDHDGDGTSDVLVGAPLGDGEDTSSGVASLVYGPVTGTLTLGSDTAELLGGENSGDNLGEVLSAHDLDGDGLPELLLGAPTAAVEADAEAGVAFVWSGGIGSEASLGDSAARWLGEGDGELAGSAMAAVDVDGDAVAELYVAAPESLFGVVYVLQDPMAGGSLSDADGRIDLTYDSAALAGGGDSDGDGLAELAVGRGDSSTGGVGIFLHVPSADYLADAEGAWSTRSADLAGASVAWAGDLDGDGLDDLLIGAPLGDGAEAEAGVVYVLYGPMDGSGYLEDQAGTTLLGQHAQDELGAAVHGPGDLDGDGLADMVLGAPAYQDAGVAVGGIAVILDAGTGSVSANAQASTMWMGDSADLGLGTALATFGDTDGDGLPELLVGVPGSDDQATDAGGVWMILSADLF